MCPPVVDIANSPKMGGKRMMFLPGGHMGPPLRRTGSIGGSYQTYFVILMLLDDGKEGSSTSTPKNLFMHSVGISR